MAALFRVDGSQQWRKYAGGAQRREMAPQMQFFGDARGSSPSEEPDRILGHRQRLNSSDK
jgi:hypothetical protein